MGALAICTCRQGVGPQQHMSIALRRFYDELWRSNHIKLRGLLDCELEASSNDKKVKELSGLDKS